MQKLMRAMHKSEKGFTLVELMVVVVIIAVLVAIAIPIYQGVQRTAAESAHDANVRTLKGAASVWFAEEGPTAVNNVLTEEVTYETITYKTLATTDNTYGGFEDYIDGDMPEVPGMIAGDDELDWVNDYPSDEPDYYVGITSSGQILVVPDIGAYGS